MSPQINTPIAFLVKTHCLLGSTLSLGCFPVLKTSASEEHLLSFFPSRIPVSFWMQFDTGWWGDTEGWDLTAVAHPLESPAPCENQQATKLLGYSVCPYGFRLRSCLLRVLIVFSESCCQCWFSLKVVGVRWESGKPLYMRPSGAGSIFGNAKSAAASSLLLVLSMQASVSCPALKVWLHVPTFSHHGKIYK